MKQVPSPRKKSTGVTRSSALHRSNTKHVKSFNAFYSETDYWNMVCTGRQCVRWAWNGTYFFQNFHGKYFSCLTSLYFPDLENLKKKKRKEIERCDVWRMFRHVVIAASRISNTRAHTRTHLAVSSFPEHSEQFETVGSDSLAVPVHAGAGELHFLRLTAVKHTFITFISAHNISNDLNHDTSTDTYGSVSATVKLHTSSCKRNRNLSHFIHLRRCLIWVSSVSKVTKRLRWVTFPMKNLKRSVLLHPHSIIMIITAECCTAKWSVFTAWRERRVRLTCKRRCLLLDSHKAFSPLHRSRPPTPGRCRTPPPS